MMYHYIVTQMALRTYFWVLGKRQRKQMCQEGVIKLCVLLRATLRVEYNLLRSNEKHDLVL